MRRPKRQRRRKSRTPKAKTQRQHAKKRAQERFGIQMDDGKYNRVIYMIQNGESTFIWRESVSRRHHRVNLDGIEMIAVYDPKAGQPPEIRTFMTVEMSEQMVQGDPKEVRYEQETVT